VFYLDISERGVDVALDVVAKTLRGSEGITRPEGILVR
jgi:hypothetical protein